VHLTRSDKRSGAPDQITGSVSATSPGDSAIDDRRTARGLSGFVQPVEKMSAVMVGLWFEQISL